MGKCSVPLCKGRGTLRFPKEKQRCAMWEKAIGENFRATKYSRLCLSHFEKDDIYQDEGYYSGN